MIIKAAKRIFNSDKIHRSYSNLNFGVTFFGTQCMLTKVTKLYDVSVAFTFLHERRRHQIEVSLLGKPTT